MKLHTSYFAKRKSLSDKDTLYIAITAFPPKWWNGPVYKKVAPPEELVSYYKNEKRRSGCTDSCMQTYIQYYKQKVLDSLVPENVYSELEEMALQRNKENVVLLCFEKTEDFCHRHILSAWLRLNGLQCEELT